VTAAAVVDDGRRDVDACRDAAGTVSYRNADGAVDGTLAVAE